MGVEDSVAEYYTHGSLERAVLGALAASHKDINRLEPADLAPVDEFHIGGRQATIEFAKRLELRRGMELLDVGCGLGGASRYFAHERGCRVVGIDLTEEYVRVATALAERVGLDALVSYRQASAFSLPFESRRFGGVYMLHVGMNIEDKARLFAEVARVLEPGGFFGIYDVMREKEGELRYPVPWAPSPATSFLAEAATYRRLLEEAGFLVEQERSRREFAVEFFKKMRQRAMQGGPPPLGLHILMGATAPQKVANMISNLEAGLISPTEMVGRLAG